MATMLRSAVLAIASRRCPRAAARVSVEPPPCEKSALPEITALAAPMPVTWIDLEAQAVLGPQAELIGDEGRR